MNRTKNLKRNISTTYFRFVMIYKVPRVRSEKPIHISIQVFNLVLKSYGEKQAPVGKTGIEDDFLNLRVGAGIQPIALVPTYSSKAKAIDDDNPLEEIASKICEEMYFVRDIPVYIPLRNINTLGIYGKQQEVRDFLNAILVHLTTHQGYDDVRVICVMQISMIWNTGNG